MNRPSPFYRIQFTLSPTRRIEMPGRPAALIYALLSNANAAEGIPAAFPHNLMLDAPETNRTFVERDEPYCFGGTLIASTPEEASDAVRRIASGLERLGEQGKSRTHGLGGNFRLLRVTDLVTSAEWSSTTCQAIPLSHVDYETELLNSVDELVLQFDTPLRLERAGKSSQPGHSFLDDRFFDVDYFISRLFRRLATVGLQLREPHSLINDSSAMKLLKNELVWLDLAYGGKNGKTLGGAVGRVIVSGTSPLVNAALVWGQYVRVGKNTSFGFGRYRIDALGADRYACRRAVPLLEVAWKQRIADRVIEKAGLESGVIGATLTEIREGHYRPHPHQFITIRSGEQARTLQIPSRRDRVLQRLVLETIAPGIDQLFESSSFAWRRGLGRHHSALDIERADRAGFRFAVNADFDRFFESIAHALLAQRLNAYIDDPATSRLVMQWVKLRHDASTGIPTGAPLSPLLGNIMLDRFDEKVHQLGGRLIRHGDDLLILCKSEEQAIALAESAWQEATNLELMLNDPAVQLDLDEPFRFLGFQFERFDKWKAVGRHAPRRLEELVCRDAAKTKSQNVRLQLALPGESGQFAPEIGLTGIVGPGATHFEISDSGLVCHYQENRKSSLVSMNDLDTLVVLGRVGMSTEVVKRLFDHSVRVLLADEKGLIYGSLCDDDLSSPDLVCGQVDASRDSVRRLAVARSLISAKLFNHAALVSVVPNSNRKTCELLQYNAEKALNATSLESLLGIEGASAARWYEQFGQSLGKGFEFPGRVAPAASDPVNILLNIGHTLIYRLTGLLIRSVGLVPGIGLLHQASRRFDALASDLQEPFRHLVDRVVIEATYHLRPSDFHRDPQSDYPLILVPHAAREYQAMLWRALSLEVQPATSGEPESYRTWMHRQVRQLARHLADDQNHFEPFRHP